MGKFTPDEEYVLDLLEKKDFRGITKNNVMTLVSALDKLDPEVAKALIEQMPEAIRGMVEIEKFYNDLLAKCVDSCAAGAESCYASEDKLIDSLLDEAAKDVPFEQKKYYFDQAANANERKSAKESEHRETVKTFVQYGLFALGTGLFFVSSMFLGSSKFRLPSNR